MRRVVTGDEARGSGVAIARGRATRRWFAHILIVIAGCAAGVLVLKWLPLLPQHNQPWIALLLPIHTALAWAFSTTQSKRVP